MERSCDSVELRNWVLGELYEAECTFSGVLNLLAKKNI